MKIIIFLFIALFSTSYTFSQSTNSSDTVVAELLGRKITESDLQKELSNDLYEMQVNIYNLKRRTLDQIIGNILLEQEAAKKKMTPQRLLEKEVQSRIKKVKDKDVDKFYEEQKERLQGTKEQNAERIRNFLQNQRYNEAIQDYLARLKKKAGAKIYLQKPERPRVTLSLAPAPLLGKQNAKVQIVEFSDFECPFCGGLTKALHKIVKKYGSNVNLTFKAFPLSRHANAPLAHQASLCADDQGKFWPFHDKLFDNQQALDRPNLEKYADQLRLDMIKFKQCLDSAEKSAKVQKELKEGEEAGVRSTPTIFVNGKMLVGNLPQEAIEEVINEELGKK